MKKSRREFMKNASMAATGAVVGPLISLPVSVLAKSQYNVGFWRVQNNGELRLTSNYALVLAAAAAIPGEVRCTANYIKAVVSAPVISGEVRLTSNYVKAVVSAPVIAGELRTTSSYAKVLVKI